MKKKVYFVLSHLRAGGSERVFWILAQYFDKSLYDISLILLDSRAPFFSTDLKDVSIIRLNSVRASKSFFKLGKLIKEQRPYAVFTTGGHINTLLSCISWFVPIPKLIGRESNVMDIMSKLGGFRDRFWDLFVYASYMRINIGVCQSAEIRESLANHYGVPDRKLVIIPNPVISTPVLAENKVQSDKKVILVARLAVEKGILRLLKMWQQLPLNYSLTIAGEGPLKELIQQEIYTLNLAARVQLAGLVSEINDLIVTHDLMVLPSITEGFPNAVLESLATGIPVVAFNVSGVKAILKNDFNGYIIDQNDEESFRRHILIACERRWNHKAIKADVIARFGVKKVVKQYEALL